MTDSPSLIGWAHSRFGKSDAPDVERLITEVSGAALEDAGIAADDVDAIYVGVYNNGLTPQGFEGALVGVGTPELARVPATHVENACATGSAALFSALDHIQAGRGRIALVIGAEKMTGLAGIDINDVLLSGSHRRTESGAGSFAGIFGMLAAQYADRYGDQRQALARIAAKNHLNGVRNPYAHMRKDLGFAFCATESERNPMVADPLLRSDCSLVSDGAAAVVVADHSIARTARRAVQIRGRKQANEPLPVVTRRDPLFFDGAAAAFRGSLTEAGVTVADLHLLETHDCFTQAELMQYEAFGLAEQGRGPLVLEEGTTYRDGALPTNVSGGLKAKGHPLGATGVSQHVMAAMQLTGEAGEMQLGTVDLAAVFNMGGAAVTNYATVMERLR
ncbi:MAG: thiolase domain-containing protein [Mycobacterium sp.]